MAGLENLFQYHQDGGILYVPEELGSDPLNADVNAGFRAVYPKLNGWFGKNSAGVVRQLDGPTRGRVRGAKLSFSSVSVVNVGVAGVTSDARDSTDMLSMEFTGVLTADITTSGSGGLDTGVEAADTWYAVHVIGSTLGLNPPNVLLSLSATAPTIPTGFDVFRRVGWIRNNSSSDFIDFLQFGNGSWRTYMWANATADRVILSGGNASGSPPTAIDGSALVPPTSTLVQASADQGGSPTVSFFLSLTGPAIATLSRQQSIAAIIPVDSSQQIFYSNSSPSGSVDVVVRGFYDEI